MRSHRRRLFRTRLRASKRGGRGAIVERVGLSRMLAAILAVGAVLHVATLSVAESPGRDAGAAANRNPTNEYGRGDPDNR